MPYISIDIELDEFDFDDILDHAVKEVKYKVSKNALRDTHKKKLKKLFNEITTSNLHHFPTKKSLMDEMKMEYLSKIFDKYTLQQIENALPEF
jgi:predicted HTH transcriptional regulator